jgi:hypothetical protein
MMSVKGFSVVLGLTASSRRRRFQGEKHCRADKRHPADGGGRSVDCDMGGVGVRCQQTDDRMRNQMILGVFGFVILPPEH